jgi:hypothetical protein
MANSDTAIVVFDGYGRSEVVEVEAGVEAEVEVDTLVTEKDLKVPRQFEVLPIPPSPFGDISSRTVWDPERCKFKTTLTIMCSSIIPSCETVSIFSSDNINIIACVNTPIMVIINALDKISLSLRKELYFDLAKKMADNEGKDGFLDRPDIIRAAMICLSIKKDVEHEERVRLLTYYYSNLFLNDRIPSSIVKITKQEDTKLLNVWHSFQSNNETNWTFELKFEQGEMKILRNVLHVFNLKGLTSWKEGKSMDVLNDPLMTQLLKLLAKAIHVRHGYTGSNREIPIPDEQYLNMNFSDKTFVCISGFKTFETPLDVIGYFMFRCIGCKISGNKLTSLFAHLYYSDTVKLNDNVGNVIRVLLSSPSAIDCLNHNFIYCSSVLWWKTREKLMADNDKIKISSKIITDDTLAMFSYLFVRWLKKSALFGVPISQIASLFGIGSHYVQQVILVEHKRLVINRYFSDFQSIIGKIYASDLNPESKLAYQTGDFQFNSDAIVDVLFSKPTLTEDILHEEYQQFLNFVATSGIVREECGYCCTSYEKNINFNWKTIECTSCPTNPIMCSNCYQRAEYKMRQEPGTKLVLSRITCPQCSNLFPDSLSLFPQGTEMSDIKDRSVEFYGCCGPRCPHFIRQQMVNAEDPTMPVPCAAYPDRVMNAYCETHLSLSLLVEEKTKECPRCHTMINKAGGCNHMTCECGCEFCFCEGCNYVKPVDSIYDHPYYCRSGISDQTTVDVLREINTDIFGQNGIVHEPLRELINQRLTSIVFEGLGEPLRTSIYHLIDYIADNVRNRGMLDNIFGNIASGCQLSFGITFVPLLMNSTVTMRNLVEDWTQ